MNIYDTAKHYYQDFTPPLWDEHRLDILVDAGKLTQEQEEEIINGKKE